MGFKPLVTFCRPVEKGVWATAVENEFGPYTPCATDSLVTGISHLAILGVCIYRIWVTKKNMKVQRFKLRSNIYNYWLGLLAFYSGGEPLFRLIMGISAFNVDGETGLAPYEIVTLVIKALAWCCMLIMISLETMVYVYEVRWFVRFSLIYALLGDAVVFGLVLSVSKYYTRYVLYLFVSEVAIQVLFGLCLFVYLPTLDPYPGYTPIRAESLDDAEYEELADGEQICPERHTNIISSIFFSWMDPLMSLGYKRPLTEKDIWKLDTWDQTETLNNKFWWGGFWKIGNDLSQFVGPLILNQLLLAMQEGGPAQIGYIYAFLIFVGVVLGVLFEAQYFQNVMRVGYRLRSTLIAAVFRKALKLTNESRRNIASGKITNLMTTDSESLQACFISIYVLLSRIFSMR
ncbi:putative ABC-type xenobiotic transporter [Helianthus annuus]|nr:putative ABC-type xenobiotic transporter [Helianthus annuus]